MCRTGADASRWGARARRFGDASHLDDTPLGELTAVLRHGSLVSSAAAEDRVRSARRRSDAWACIGAHCGSPFAVPKRCEASAGCCAILGWNVMPTARNARGVDIIAYSRDATHFCGIQVKALSKRSPVPLGNSLDKIMGDFWVIVNKVASPSPCAFVLLPMEVRERAHRGEKDGRVSYWLQPGEYEQDAFRDNWQRIGRGGVAEDDRGTSLD